MTDDRTDYPEDAWSHLAPLLTPSRRERMLATAHARTGYVRLVVQDIHNPHNVSACMRSADAFGVQDVDVVTLRESFRASTVARGVANWLTIRRWHDVQSCADTLKRDGYRIVAGVPRQDAVALHELPLDQPIAVIFGNEHQGIDPAWLERIDTPFTIPMVGMVESLNISVCAAITLYQLTRAARAAVPAERYLLSAQERNHLLATWSCRQVTAWPEVLARLRETPTGR